MTDAELCRYVTMSRGLSRPAHCGAPRGGGGLWGGSAVGGGNWRGLDVDLSGPERLCDITPRARGPLFRLAIHVQKPFDDECFFTRLYPGSMVILLACMLHHIAWPFLCTHESWQCICHRRLQRGYSRESRVSHGARRLECCVHLLRCCPLLDHTPRSSIHVVPFSVGPATSGTRSRNRKDSGPSPSNLLPIRSSARANTSNTSYLS